jgi:hypothetical protein
MPRAGAIPTPPAIRQKPAFDAAVRLGARAERERVGGDRERRSADRDPRELAGFESQSVVADRAQGEHSRAVTFRRYPFDRPRPPTYLEWTKQAHPHKQPDERCRHERPQHLLPEVVDVVVHQQHVNQGSHDRDHCQYGVQDLPPFIGESQLPTPYGGGHQRHQGGRSDRAEPHSGRRLGRSERRDLARSADRATWINTNAKPA